MNLYLHGLEPTIFLGDKLWSVANYEGSYLGTIDLNEATIHSDNAVYAQLTQLVGARKVAETARRLGIRSELSGFYSIGLGTEAVNPLEMARAYTAVNAGGVLVLCALLLAFAAETAGLGPDRPLRHDYFEPRFYTEHVAQLVQRQRAESECARGAGAGPKLAKPAQGRSFAGRSIAARWALR